MRYNPRVKISPSISRGAHLKLRRVQMVTELINQLHKAGHTSVVVFLCATFCCVGDAADSNAGQESTKVGSVIVHHATAFDVSPPLASARPVVPAQSSETNSEACCGLSPDFSD